jgi:hypothetical protein
MSRPRLCMKPLTNLRPLEPLKPLLVIGSKKWRTFKSFRSCKAILQAAETFLQEGADLDCLSQFYLQVAKHQPKLFMRLVVRVLRFE